MDNTDTLVQEDSVGTMMPIVQPDQVLRKVTESSIDEEFNALQIFPDMKCDDLPTETNPDSTSDSLNEKITDNSNGDECGDILNQYGIESVVKQCMEENENEDRVEFESSEEQISFIRPSFDYDDSKYQKAILDFFGDVTADFDNEELQSIRCSGNSIVIETDPDLMSDRPIAEHFFDNLSSLSFVKRHELFEYATYHVLQYNEFVFCVGIDLQTYDVTIELLYVEGGTTLYSLDELISFMIMNKKKIDIHGEITTFNGTNLFYKKICAKGIFSRESRIVKSKTQLFIEFADDSYGESTDEDFYTESAKIDDDIRDIIKTLNDKGYETLYSCSGHPSARLKSDGKRDGIKDKKLYSTAKIVFAEDYKFNNYPTGWEEKKLDKGNVGIYVKGPTFRIINGLPTEQFYAWKKKYMYHLEKWANELPKKEDLKKTEEDVQESVMDIFQDLLIDLS